MTTEKKINNMNVTFYADGSVYVEKHGNSMPLNGSDIKSLYDEYVEVQRTRGLQIARTKETDELRSDIAWINSQVSMLKCIAQAINTSGGREESSSRTALSIIERIEALAKLKSYGGVL